MLYNIKLFTERLQIFASLVKQEGSWIPDPFFIITDPDQEAN